MVESVLRLRASAAGFGCGLALVAVIDHALDDGLAKAHDIIVVDGGSGCEEAVGKVHMGLAKEFDGKGKWKMQNERPAQNGEQSLTIFGNDHARTAGRTQCVHVLR